MRLAQRRRRLSRGRLLRLGRRSLVYAILARLARARRRTRRRAVRSALRRAARAAARGRAASPAGSRLLPRPGRPRGLERLEPRLLLSGSLSVTIDYSFDDNNFFDTQEKKDLLQQAADDVASHFGDDLQAIVPDSTEDPDNFADDCSDATGNVWETVFTDPGTGNTAEGER